MQIFSGSIKFSEIRPIQNNYFIRSWHRMYDREEEMILHKKHKLKRKNNIFLFKASFLKKLNFIEKIKFINNI